MKRKGKPSGIFNFNLIQVWRAVKLPGAAILLILSAGITFGQPISNHRTLQIRWTADTIILDTLSIVPGSVEVKYRATDIDAGKYTILYPEAFIIFNGTQNGMDSLTIHYRVFPYALGKDVFHKDYNQRQPEESALINPFKITLEREKQELFATRGIKKSGSISRGISFGNNQDVVLNSGMNLQMAGQLGENTEILAAITDENIPFQPEGNTQQLQEFDKVYIQLSGNTTRLTAGDYDLKKPEGYFLNYFKRSKGGTIQTVQPFRIGPSPNLAGKNKTILSGAVSRGKYARNVFNGSEGNQGPYQLTGANNETFIFILSGSEQVFINGQKMERGFQQDYIIDYNTAQITFTPKRIITKDLRISIEFQYSELNYLRSLAALTNETQFGKVNLRINLYSEQDSKNQGLNQKLSDEDKRLLSETGDSASLSMVSSALITEGAFDPDLVHYVKRDTVANGVLYPDIFVYQPKEDSVLYSVGFTFAGQGNGDYVSNPGETNGKVYAWVAPVDGVQQGSWIPFRFLVAPKKQQMVSVGADYQAGKNTLVSLEGALSNFDKNTFSNLNTADDVGLAGRAAIKHSIPVDRDSAGWKLVLGGDYEFKEKTFNFIERYRPVEFERDWNLTGENPFGEEHLAGVSAGIAKEKEGGFYLKYRRFNRDKNFEGALYGMNARIRNRKYRIDSEGSLMASTGLKNRSQFIRHKGDYARLFKWVAVGLRAEGEENQFREKLTDTLASTAYAFQEWEGYLMQSDTSVNKFRIYYGQREDKGIRFRDFRRFALSRNAGYSNSFLKNPDHSITLQANYRNLEIKDSTLTLIQPEETVVCNLDHSLNLSNQAFSFSTYYEIGTGREQKKEFAYLETAAGQGTHEWLDYNQNGLKELDEFEPATISSRGTFIKVLVPTDQFIRSNSNKFSEVFGFNPGNFFENPKGIAKFISRFNNQFLFRKETKSSDPDLTRVLNLFETPSTGDSTFPALSRFIQEILYFNRNGAKFGLDWSYHDNNQKSVLTGGFESRSLRENIFQGRWNFSKFLGISGAFKKGNKNNFSEFLPSRNFDLRHYTLIPKFIIQSGSVFRFVLSYEYNEKTNIMGSHEFAVQNKAGADIKLSSAKKGTLNARFSYILVSYNGLPNSALAFEMLDGFQKGENYTWGLVLQRTLSSGLQINLNYEGRQTAGNSTIHAGGVQLRAFF